MAKSKLNFLINIVGLSIGLACCILVVLFVRNELTYDQFHSKSEQIYRPYMVSFRGGQESTNVATPGPLGPTIIEEIPEIEDYVVLSQFSDLIKKGNDPIQENVLTASAGFFRVFDFEVLNGSVEGVFEAPDDIVITASMAEKYFGNADPVGQSLEVHVGDIYRIFQVKAVTADVPSNSSLQYDFIVSSENNKYIYPERMLNSWFAMMTSTYFLLRPGTVAAEVEAKFPDFLEEIYAGGPGGFIPELHLQAITDIHLNTELPQGTGSGPVSDPMYSYILGSVALVILLVACVNFMNLSIGLSISRAKEISMRKVMGAEKRQIIFQFISEALILTLMAVMIGVLLAVAFLPTFNDLSGQQLSIDWTVQNLLYLLGIAVIVGLGAGFYPALVLSNFKPLNVLKGNLRLGMGKNHLRKAMMVLQFVFSIFLIGATLIMSKQLRYLNNKNLGFDQESLVIVEGYSTGRGIREMVTKGREQSELYKTELLSNPNILGVSISSFTPAVGGWLEISFMEQGERRDFEVNVVEEDYVTVNGMQIVEGRDFSRETASDASSAIIVNEAFRDAFGLGVGDKIPGSFGSHQIIGVVQDFNYESLHTPVGPVVLVINAEIIFSGAQGMGMSSSPSPKLSVRVKPNGLRDALDFMEETWSDVYPGAPYEFEFLDDRLAAQYEQEQQLGKIITTAATLAIVIGCLGLFALSKLSIESSAKEIGIRKVLGASYQTILFSLSKGYGVLILIAFFLAVPATYYLIKDWLSGFEYSIQLSGLEFLLAGLLTIAIAAITLSFHSMKIARANPALTLRDE